MDNVKFAAVYVNGRRETFEVSTDDAGVLVKASLTVPVSKAALGLGFIVEGGSLSPTYMTAPPGSDRDSLGRPWPDMQVQPRKPRRRRR